jgi:hypothetical protein
MIAPSGRVNAARRKREAIQRRSGNISSYNLLKKTDFD